MDRMMRVEACSEACSKNGTILPEITHTHTHTHTHIHASVLVMGWENEKRENDKSECRRE